MSPHHICSDLTEQAGAQIATQPLLLVIKDMPRVDSRLLAANMGKAHQSLFELVKDYRADFEELGKVRFETGASPGSKTGQTERFAMLSEDQAYLLLTYTRNTARTRQLKIKLVKAFAEARRAAQVHTAEYLPTYHALHDEIHALADGSTNERFAHMNLNKLVNRVAGIGAGQRGDLTAPKQSLLVVAQDLAAQAMHGAANHHEAYAVAKAVLSSLGRVLEVSK